MEFRQILIDIGGHPRVFETFIEILLEEMTNKQENILKWVSYDQNNQINQLKIPFDFNWEKIYKQIEDYVKIKYKEITILPFHVIQNAFLGKKITNEDEAVFYLFYQ